MRKLLFLITLLAACAAQAELSADDARAVFAVGLRAYEASDYVAAAGALEQVLELERGCARCAHLLGRSYGRMAEQASGLSKLGLARKTRDALELAVALDPDDTQAVADLIRYYRAAPGFLGGSMEKARMLEQRLEHASSDHNS